MSEKKNEDETVKRKQKNKIVIPRRLPSIVISPKEIIYITADKITCVACPCYPTEEPYVNNKLLNQCQNSPLTLYELAAFVVDNLAFPEAFDWSVEDVAEWMAKTVGLPRYKECIIDNHIDGMRLLRLEDPSVMPEINIHDWEHMKLIVSNIRKLYGTDFVKFSRSLAARYPLTYCTWFKSRTGPNWGIRKNWMRCDILRWMKILMPAPIYLDHWDLVWYHKPEFPKIKFARLPKRRTCDHIPKYKPVIEICNEYLAPRKFKLDPCINESQQFIWMEHYPPLKPKKEKRPKKVKQKNKKINLEEVRGDALILARRKMPREKFLA